MKTSQHHYNVFFKEKTFLLKLNTGTCNSKPLMNEKKGDSKFKYF